MVTKSKYNINVVSENGWVPFASNNTKSINNRSSVKHNIISHDNNQFSGGLTLGLLDKQVTNMKKGIGEFGDMQRPTANNINHAHRNAVISDPHVFKRKDGIFSHLYDAAHRFGESKPFQASGM